MRIAIRIVLVVLVVFVVIQFIRPARNKDDTVSGTGISSVIPVPDSVVVILNKACYDCHSNNTRYPWYANIQPVGWFLSNHIKDGKGDLNFSEFAGYTKRRQLNKLGQISEIISKDEMPLKSYKMMHKEAQLNSNEKALLINWAEKSRVILEAKE